MPEKIVTDPSLLEELNGPTTGKVVTDQNILSQLNGAKTATQKTTTTTPVVSKVSGEPLIAQTRGQIKPRLGQTVSEITEGETGRSQLSKSTPIKSYVTLPVFDVVDKKAPKPLTFSGMAGTSEKTEVPFTKPTTTQDELQNLLYAKASQGKSDDALAVANMLKEKNPEDYYADEIGAHAYMKKQDYKNAAILYKGLYEKKPELLLRSVDNALYSLYQSGDKTNTLDVANFAINNLKDTENVDELDKLSYAYKAKANIYEDLGETETAKLLTEKSLQADNFAKQLKDKYYRNEELKAFSGVTQYVPVYDENGSQLLNPDGSPQVKKQLSNSFTDYFLNNPKFGIGLFVAPVKGAVEGVITAKEGVAGLLNVKEKADNIAKAYADNGILGAINEGITPSEYQLNDALKIATGAVSVFMSSMPEIAMVFGSMNTLSDVASDADLAMGGAITKSVLKGNAILNALIGERGISELYEDLSNNKNIPISERYEKPSWFTEFTSSPVTSTLLKTGLLTDDDIQNKTTGALLSQIGDLAGVMVLFKASGIELMSEPEKWNKEGSSFIEYINSEEGKKENARIQSTMKKVSDGTATSDEIKQLDREVVSAIKSVSNNKLAVELIKKIKGDFIDDSQKESEEKIAFKDKDKLNAKISGYSVEQDNTGKFAVLDKDGNAVKHFETKNEAQNFISGKQETEPTEIKTVGDKLIDLKKQQADLVDKKNPTNEELREAANIEKKIDEQESALSIKTKDVDAEIKALRDERTSLYPEGATELDIQKASEREAEINNKIATKLKERQAIRNEELNKPLEYDSKDKTRVSSEIGVGEKPVSTEPVERTGGEEIKANRIFQTSPGEGEVIGEKLGKEVDIDLLSEQETISEIQEYAKKRGIEISPEEEGAVYQLFQEDIEANPEKKVVDILDETLLQHDKLKEVERGEYEIPEVSDKTETSFESGKEEVSEIKSGKITTKNPIKIFKGLFGKRNPDGTVRTAHPNVKGIFGSVEEESAKRYAGEKEEMKTFDIPEGTTIEVVEVADKKQGFSKIRKQETEMINNSDAQIVKLRTIDASGKFEDQYIIKDKSLIEPKPEVKADVTRKYEEYDATDNTKARQFALDVVENDYVTTYEPTKEKGAKKTTQGTEAARFDLGMTNVEKIKAINDIKVGNYETAPAKKLLSALEGYYKDGTVKFIEGGGGKSVRSGIPIADFVKDVIDTKTAKEQVRSIKAEPIIKEKEIVEEAAEVTGKQKGTKQKRKEKLSEGEAIESIESDIELSKTSPVKNLQDRINFVTDDVKRAELQERYTEANNQRSEIKTKQKQSTDIRENIDTPQEDKSKLSEGDIVVENSFIPESAKKKISKWFKEQLSVSGNLPKVIFSEKVKLNGRLGARQRQLEVDVSNLRKIAKKEWGSPTVDQIKLIDDVLHGVKPITDLPTNMQSHIKSMRNAIDGLTREMISMGLVDGDLITTLSDNLGTYMNRSYRLHDDPKWFKNIPKDVINKAKNYINNAYSNKGITLTAEEIDGLINYITSDAKFEPSQIIRGRKLGSMDLSALKKKKDIPVEIRDLMGEYKDPYVNYARTFSKMTHAIEHAKFLNEVAKSTTGKYFFKRPTGEFSEPISAESNPSMKPLSGLFTSKEIKAEFDNLNSLQAQSKLINTWMTINGIAKYSKTILSPITHVRNFTSNFLFHVANGHYRAGKMSDAVKLIAEDITKNKPGSEQKLQRLIELGIVKESVSAGELRDVINDAMTYKNDIEAFYENRAKKITRKILKVPEEAYRIEDDFHKIYAFYNELADLTKAYEGTNKPIFELEQMAANKVRATMPTYSLVPKLVKSLRRLPLVGSFVSFPAEVFRNSFNTVDLAMKELKNPKERILGAKRLIGFSAALVLPGAISAVSRSLSGVSDEEDDDLSRFLPEWSKNSQIVIVKKDLDNGVVTYVDASYSDPYNYLKRGVIALGRGGDPQKAVVEVLSEYFKPFLSEEMMTSKMLDVSRNIDGNTGKKIYNNEDYLGEQSLAIFGHLWKGMEPGIITQTKNLFDSEKDLKIEALSTFTGQRISKIDLKKNIMFKGIDYSKRKTEIKALYNSVFFNDASTDEEKKKAYDKANDLYGKLYDGLIKDIDAAERLGIKKDIIKSSLLNGGVGKKEVEVILNKKFVPFEEQKTDAEKEAIKKQKEITKYVPI